MSLYFAFPTLLLAAILQSTWLERLTLLGGRPDLVLVLVVTWAIIRGLDEGVLWGFVGGLCCDLLSGGPLGIWTTALTLATFLAGQPWVQTLGPTSIRLALMAGIGTLVTHGVVLGLLSLLGYPVSLEWAFRTTIVPAALLNFILTPFAFRFLVWFHQRSLRQSRLGL